MLALNQYTRHLGLPSEMDRTNQMEVVMMMFKKFQVAQDQGKTHFI